MWRIKNPTHVATMRKVIMRFATFRRDDGTVVAAFVSVSVIASYTRSMFHASNASRIFVEQNSRQLRPRNSLKFLPRQSAPSLLRPPCLQACCTEPATTSETIAAYPGLDVFCFVHSCKSL